MALAMPHKLSPGLTTYTRYCEPVAAIVDELGLTLFARVRAGTGTVMCVPARMRWGSVSSFISIKTCTVVRYRWAMVERVSPG